MQKPVPIAFRCKRGGFYLLHHHHEHNQEDGESRPDDAYRTDDGMLAELRQRLGDVLFYHIVQNVSRFFKNASAFCLKRRDVLKKRGDVFLFLPLVKGARGMSLWLGFRDCFHAEGTSPCPPSQGGFPNKGPKNAFTSFTQA